MPANADNALTDIAWVQTTSGDLTVKETLLRAHEIKGLGPALSGTEYGATFRFLHAVAARVITHMLKQTGQKLDDLDSGDEKNILGSTFNEADVDAALAEMESHAHLVHDEYPFMAQPTLGFEPTKPPTVLRPSIVSEKDSQFWTLLVEERPLTKEEAALALVVAHNYFPVGNNQTVPDYPHQLDKRTKNGAPGFRLTGGKGIAEVILTEPNLHDTLIANLPRDFIDAGLPAWADRDHNHGGRLWEATWSSNAPTTRFDGSDNLVSAGIGAIPDKWCLPEQGHFQDITDQLDAIKADTTLSPRKVAAKVLAAQQAEKGRVRDIRRDWWDARNELDPFYLETVRENGTIRKFRAESSRHQTQLAIEWLLADSWGAASAKAAANNLVPPSTDTTLTFLAHRESDNTQSPSIRDSRVLRVGQKEWAPSEDVYDSVIGFARLLDEISKVVLAPFRESKFNRAYLTGMGQWMENVTHQYWADVSESFSSGIATLSNEDDITDRQLSRLHQDALKAARDALYANESTLGLKGIQTAAVLDAQVSTKIRNYQDSIDPHTEEDEDNE